MSGPDRHTFSTEVYEIIRQIPRGYVLTYGRIASLAGWPMHSRMAGKVLCNAPEELHLPCHRVVNSCGRTAPGWPEQARMLSEEGVRIKKNGCVDLSTHLWQPELEL